MNKTVLIAGLTLTVPLVLVLGFGLRFDPRAIDSPLIGQSAPAFSLQTVDGKTVDSADLRGQPYVLNFWSTWCQPCMAEHPVLLRAADDLAGEVAFLGVVYQDEPENIAAFQRQFGSWGPALVDEGQKLAIAFGVYGVPETFIVDRSGIVAHKITGPTDRRNLDLLLSSLP